MSSMYGEARDSVKTSPSLVPTVGAFVTFPLHERFEMQAELLFTVKGVKQEFTGDLLGGSMAFSESGYLLYAELPVLFRFPFPGKGVRRTVVYTGPYGALNMWSHTRGEYEVEGTTASSGGSFSGSIGNVNRLDFGIIAGFDHRFSWGEKALVLDLRYTYGLRQVFSDLEDRFDVPDGDIPYVYSYSDQAKGFKNASISLTLSMPLKP
ncbi:MAG: PorT family protein [bacterium]|nr:PorT family protein [bacterium]